jgi:hypothetical protein
MSATHANTLQPPAIKRTHTWSPSLLPRAPLPLSLNMAGVKQDLALPEGPGRAKLPQPKNLLFIEPEVTTPVVTPRNGETADPLAQAGQKLSQKNLPHVHSEPAEYYGGTQVWSRARTFSNVSHVLETAS